MYKQSLGSVKDNLETVKLRKYQNITKKVLLSVMQIEKYLDGNSNKLNQGLGQSKTEFQSEYNKETVSLFKRSIESYLYLIV